MAKPGLASSVEDSSLRNKDFRLRTMLDPEASKKFSILATSSSEFEDLLLSTTQSLSKRDVAPKIGPMTLR